ncbi:thioredoxin [Lactobacillus selangorensis]|uniref:Thioredoxin n=1 Tax=Lactobacillus selangorensis TaxID=81857 RepID=A0A0R2FFW3_9LACO|nr:thioredoxin [Lactobacillus selangorensis]KRN27459.1 thioredoxin [Lactobacillus selangorensis]KRN31344.1 thioredoxin [Lactobacillus selangorensis]
MAVEVVTDQDFEEKTSQGVTLTDFWATWCGPCKMQSPVIEELSTKDNKVKFSKMDVDANPKTPESFGIMAIPTLLVKKDGQVVDRIVGYHSADQLEDILNKYTA